MLTIMKGIFCMKIFSVKGNMQMVVYGMYYGFKLLCPDR